MTSHLWPTDTTAKFVDYFRESWLSALLYITLMILLLTWSFLLAFFFGHDVLNSTGNRRAKP